MNDITSQNEPESLAFLPYMHLPIAYMYNSGCVLCVRALNFNESWVKLYEIENDGKMLTGNGGENVEIASVVHIFVANVSI